MRNAYYIGVKKRRTNLGSRRMNRRKGDFSILLICQLEVGTRRSLSAIRYLCFVSTRACEDDGRVIWVYKCFKEQEEEENDDDECE